MATKKAPAKATKTLAVSKSASAKVKGGRRAL